MAARPIRYAGSQVEISITALSDWGLQQFPGVFVDDIVVSTARAAPRSRTTPSRWTAGPCRALRRIRRIEEPNRNDWVRRGGLGIKEGAVVKTPDTLYMGFGFEGITGAKARNDVMKRSMDYLRR